eukprot:1365514-Pyramimonas_sp.AAC.1
MGFGLALSQMPPGARRRSLAGRLAGGANGGDMGSGRVPAAGEWGCGALRVGAGPMGDWRGRVANHST